MKKALLIKTLTIGIIFLFIGVSVVTSTISNVVAEKSLKKIIKNFRDPLLPPLMWTEDFSTFYISIPGNPDVGDVYYWIEWGDGSSTNWVGPFNSNETITISHVWSEQGSYQITVKAKNQDVESKCAIYGLILFSDFKFFYPTLGYVSITYIFTVHYEGCIYYIFDWGDGNNSGWVGPMDPVIMYKAWDSHGEYLLKVKAKDIYGNETPWSDPYLITILPIENQGPTAPIITGPRLGRVGIKYDYAFNSTDYSCEDLIYMIEWGDGTYSQIIGPSGKETITNHTWSKNGMYVITAKSKNFLGIESGWGKLKVIMPRNRVSCGSFLLHFLERFPMLERLLFLLR